LETDEHLRSSPDVKQLSFNAKYVQRLFITFRFYFTDIWSNGREHTFHKGAIVFYEFILLVHFCEQANESVSRNLNRITIKHERTFE